ncbi:hypothetical protein ABIE61_001089 [Marinobacterium sp. MBR-111]|jgi:hypothetical protein
MLSADPQIFDAYDEAWVPLNIDFSRYTSVHFLGLELPFMLEGGSRQV